MIQIRYLLFREMPIKSDDPAKAKQWCPITFSDATEEAINGQFDYLKANEHPTPRLRILKVTEEVVREE